MRIFTLGSINIDRVYRLDHFVAPGETETADSFDVFPGGKGYNQTMALARAGALVSLIGAVGSDGSWLLVPLREAGVDTTRVTTIGSTTGHAVIQVDHEGRNNILVFPGANGRITKPMLVAGLSFAHPGDVFLTQNETACTAEGIRLAKDKGMTVALNPSPFNERIAALPLDLVDVFLVNEGEACALAGKPAGTDPGAALVALRIKYRAARFVLTLGEKGVIFSGPDSPAPISVPARTVPVADTTAAGDTFTGYYLAAISRGRSEREALERATAAAAICVSRRGAAPSVPVAREVDAYLAGGPLPPAS